MKAVSERHVQALWYDAALRPPGLFTRCGTAVKVISPGEWNLGAGHHRLLSREDRDFCLPQSDESLI